MTAQLVELKDFSEGRGEMAETRKREELYRDVWREPMLQLAKKYGVSDVMLAKVCRKLHIPAPGRGYWARKASGQKLSVEPLPELKDVPVIQRFKLPEPELREPKIPEPEPADSEYLRIKEIETLKIAVDTNAPIHRLVAITIKAFKSATTDDRGFRTTGHKEGELDVRISPASLERAIAILNAVITALERLGYPVNVKPDAFLLRLISANSLHGCDSRRTYSIHSSRALSPFWTARRRFRGVGNWWRFSSSDVRCLKR